MKRPCLQPSIVALSAAMSSGYQHVTGRLLVPAAASDDLEALSTALYHAPFALLCHDGGDDPRFRYANLTAQKLWRRPWDDFMGLPSRLSAPPQSRDSRAEMLASAMSQGYVEGYSGVRIDARGHLFTITDALIWNVTGPFGSAVGQAARIDTWSDAEPDASSPKA